MALPSGQSASRVLHAGDHLLVVHDFDARSSDELTLRKGDKIELVELDDGFGDGWYLGKHLSKGITGLFPGVYTTKVPTSFYPNHAPGAATRSSLPVQQYSSQPQYHNHSLPFHPSSQPSSYRTQSMGFAGTQQAPPFAQPASSGEPRPASTNIPPSSISPAVQRSIGQTLADPHVGQDSPVMNETLSVIEEHMQDMSTPRESLMVPHAKRGDDSESEYSSHLNDRQSYLAGPETDDEDSSRLTEAQVRSWDHHRTAQYLRNAGVDPRHCDIFEDQEINGEVLLEMDQAFIYMKEFDFGVMGKRLKTWHKVRTLQEEVKGHRISPQTTKTSMSNAEPFDPLPHAHTMSAVSGPVMMPQMSGLAEQPAYRSQQQANAYMNEQPNTPQPLQTQSNANKRSSIHGSTPSSPWRASMLPESPSRPSAALIREISHSRRHSSIDLNNHPPFDVPPSPSVGATTAHKKQPSLDRDWAMVSSTPLPSSTTAPSSRLPTMRQQSTTGSFEPSLQTDHSSVDLLDRGYFSGPEGDSRKNRNVLRKRDSQASPAHSRQSSMLEDSRRNTPPMKKHSRLSSVDSIKDLAPRMTSSAARAYHSKVFRGRMRSSSARTPSPLPYTSAVSPTVTNLENGASPTQQLQTPFSPAPPPGSIADKARRVMGLRAISDAVTGNEKAIVSPGGAGVFSESPIDSPDGSVTPSGTSRSLEMENAETSSKGTDPIGTTLATQTSNRPRPKTKQQTSAYTKGLQKVRPAEARQTADYSGWMKKKSAGILTTWKPRLFVLHGRRLSYYYSENDSEERGIIDISGHKVLVANSDPVTTLHATITGAASSSPQAAAGALSSVESSPTATRSPTMNSANSAPGNTMGLHSGPFYFKLVPPKAGFSRAVQFTKPTVHYFQVDGIAQGRKWMGEMMKATIEHDLSTYETTNKQKTISLAKARARRERPPALWDTEIDPSPAPIAQTDVQPAAESASAGDPAGGLQIQGLNFEKENREPGKKSSFEGIFDEKQNQQVPLGTSEGSESVPVPIMPDQGQKVA